MKCLHCQAELLSSPECQDRQWFIRCLDCGAKNLVVIGPLIVGWQAD